MNNKFEIKEIDLNNVSCGEITLDSKYILVTRDNELFKYDIEGNLINKVNVGNFVIKLGNINKRNCYVETYNSIKILDIRTFKYKNEIKDGRCLSKEIMGRDLLNYYYIKDNNVFNYNIYSGKSEKLDTSELVKEMKGNKINDISYIMINKDTNNLLIVDDKNTLLVDKDFKVLKRINEKINSPVLRLGDEVVNDSRDPSKILNEFPDFNGGYISLDYKGNFFKGEKDNILNTHTPYIGACISYQGDCVLAFKENQDPNYDLGNTVDIIRGRFREPEIINRKRLNTLEI